MQRIPAWRSLAYVIVQFRLLGDIQWQWGGRRHRLKLGRGRLERLNCFKWLERK